MGSSKSEGIILVLLGEKLGECERIGIAEVGGESSVLDVSRGVMMLCFIKAGLGVLCL